MDRRSEVSTDSVDQRRAARSDTGGLALMLGWDEPRPGLARVLGRRRSDRTLVKVIDLSLTGARIEAPSGIELRVGQTAELAVDEDCRARAVVRHVEASESRTLLGLEFTTVHNPATSAFFQRLLDDVSTPGLRWDDMPLREDTAEPRSFAHERNSGVPAMPADTDGGR